MPQHWKSIVDGDSYLVVRAPHRLSLGGGGTDLPSYYERYGGYLVAVAITRYLRVRVGGRCRTWVRLEPGTPALAAFHALVPGLADVAVATTSDVPAGSGLGSSGALATALVAAANAIGGRPSLRPHELAARAYFFERAALTASAGRQDTLVAAHGGLREYEIGPAGVTSRSLVVSPVVRQRLETNLLLVDTRVRRRAETLLADQRTRLDDGDAAMAASLHRVKELGRLSAGLFRAGDLDGYAELMHEHWMVKRERSPGMSTPDIDRLYDLGRRNGVVGGKLVGAGGGGFLLLYSRDPAATLAAYAKAGYVGRPVGVSDTGAVIESPTETSPGSASDRRVDPTTTALPVQPAGSR